jgi:hypothetical protein
MGTPKKNLEKIRISKKLEKEKGTKKRGESRRKLTLLSATTLGGLHL